MVIWSNRGHASQSGRMSLSNIENPFSHVVRALRPSRLVRAALSQIPNPPTEVRALRPSILVRASFSQIDKPSLIVDPENETAC